MTKKESNLTLGISESEKVDQFLENFEHPLKEIIITLRELIMNSNIQIGEGIYWNAPTFFYTGDMQPFDPKTYKRYLIGFVLNKQNLIRMVLLHGNCVDDKQQILEGKFKDNRKLVVFKNLEDVHQKKDALKEILQELILQITIK